ncbi:MAG: hypothetical protein OSA45_14125 [Halioglobus sp.]|nr:hypothetical protein [Halioglobus sp.]
MLTIKYLWRCIFLAALVWSGVAPKDRLTWVLEVAVALIAREILTRKNVVNGGGWFVLCSGIHDRQLDKIIPSAR